MNRGSRSTGYVSCFASWPWPVSFPNFYRFVSAYWGIEHVNTGDKSELGGSDWLVFRVMLLLNLESCWPVDWERWASRPCWNKRSVGSMTPETVRGLWPPDWPPMRPWCRGWGNDLYRTDIFSCFVTTHSGSLTFICYGFFRRQVLRLAWSWTRWPTSEPLSSSPSTSAGSWRWSLCASCRSLDCLEFSKPKC